MLVLLFSANSFAQGGFTNENLKTAERNWKPFFTKFKTAVRNRDQATLKTMMPVKFYCWYFEVCRLDRDGNVVDSDKEKNFTTDSVFKSWNKNNNRGWNRLKDVVNRGVVETLPADPVKTITLPNAKCETDYYMLFNFEDGRWIFEIFMVMGCGGH
jgi:hypothetical protein